MNTLKTRRWLSDTSLVLLAMHPTAPMKARAVYQNMVDIGFPGNFGHARKAMNIIKRTYIYQSQPRYWALTATGAVQRGIIIGAMHTVLDHVRNMHMPTPPPVIGDQARNHYAPNGEGYPVCTGCGVPLRQSHMPSCKVAFVTATERLDTDVTVR